MKIDILTLFPQMFVGPLTESIIKRARQANIMDLSVHDLRVWAKDLHHTVDDRPYGGGVGMVIKPDIVFAAVESLAPISESCILLTCPRGQLFDQSAARRLAGIPHLIVICGHYEGVDERVREHLATAVFSIGDVVLTGGELPAMIIVDAVVRLLPGVVGKEASTQEESFSGGLLDYPQYTRPANFRNWQVPDVLLSGDHEKIALWRRRKAISRTLEQRPELLAKAALTAEEREWLRREYAWNSSYDENLLGKL
ncbi:MAG: tRNA (guanosine(37)-N1)-methyltransferase TrmD [Cyanobacteria bacterium NC_groundwater_1444_Ag_S-0.65um_54_12]|nr:tRNA (guanosine(37)-N1)-methyltransferase TrmD [Cyanobacteria bacterium NC_groundwater_1444_Ag_S-0.65um_54_12]